MKFYLKAIIIFLFFFQIHKSFAEMVTFNSRETVNAEGSTSRGGSGSANNDWGLAAGIEFNADGSKMFVSFAQVFETQGMNSVSVVDRVINTYNLSTRYDLSTISYAGDDERCEFEFDEGDQGQQLYDLELTNDGMKILVVSRRAQVNDEDFDKAYVLNLTSPYDISSCTRSSATNDLDSAVFQNGSLGGDRAESSTGKKNNLVEGVEINKDGTKLFLLYRDTISDNGVGGRLLEYNLSTPYDLSETSLSLVTTAGIKFSEDDSTGVHGPASIRFRPDGKRFFIVSHAHSGTQRVLQVTLTNAYDTSSYVIDGSFVIKNLSGYNNSQPRGIAFSENGLKMYITKDRSKAPDINLDQVIEYDLACPFTVIASKCPPITENKDRTGIAEAQIDIAKRTMEYSTDSALNRLRWIRRNKEKQNLTNHNIDFDFSNPIMSRLAKKISTSNTEDKQEEKNQDVFYWSEGSISLGKIGDSSISSSKEISTDALTFGFDKFIDEKSLSGFAFRFGKNDTDVGSLGSNLDTDTYNLTFYNTTSKDNDTKFIDTILGVGKLNYDILTVLDNKNLTAEREGYQFYGTIRAKDEIKKDELMLIPSVQLDLGRSFLLSYVESSGTGAISVDNQDVRTNKLRAAISLVEDLSKDDYVFKKHGKFEYSADLARSSNFKYFYVSAPNTRFSEELSSGALHNLSGELGLDMVLRNNFSIFLIYEREQAIGYGHTDQIHIALGYLPDNKVNYALKVDAKDDLRSKVLISKKFGDYKLSFDHSHDFLSEEDNYLSSINLSKDF